MRNALQREREREIDETSQQTLSGFPAFLSRHRLQTCLLSERRNRVDPPSLPSHPALHVDKLRGSEAETGLENLHNDTDSSNLPNTPLGLISVSRV